MKVAIIGAGLAGLSCAHELELNGIAPDIFERNGYIGEQINHVGVLLEVIYRPLHDILDFMENNLHIAIKPLNPVHTLYHKSQFATASIKGKLGYFTMRSRSDLDLKVQLCSKLKKSNILLNTFAECSELARRYDFVIDASGSSLFAKELGCWHQYISCFIRGAVVYGNFNPNTVIMYLNKTYSNNGYAYLTPFNSKKGCVALVVPYVDDKEIDFFWESFLAAENIKYEIEEEFKQLHLSGFVYPMRTENILFAGGSGGAIDPLLGFGQFNSIYMGVMAARSILTGEDYPNSVQRIVRRVYEIYKIRKAYDSLSNKGLDNFISLMHLPGVNSILYNTNIDVIKYGSMLFKKM